MKIVVMNKAVLCLFAVFFFANLAYSQQNHFIYIQSDDKQTFTVSVNGTQYTSSEAGYVIVPKLSAAQYNLKISFPGNKYPEQSFVCQLNSADAGYALKNYGDKGWGLFNFQTLDLIMAGTTMQTEAKKADTATAKNVFGEMLSDVVDDSTLTKNMVQEKPVEKKPAVEEKNIQKEDDTKVADNGISQSVVPEVLVPAAAVAVPVVANKEKKSNAKPENKQAIKIISDVEAGEGRELIFAVPGKGKLDTIKIVIPADSNYETNMDSDVVAKSVQRDTVAKTLPVVTEDQSKVVTPADAKTDGGIKNPFYVPAAESAVVVADTKPVEKAVSDPLANADTEKRKAVKEEQAAGRSADTKDCKKMFSENDFDKLKHKMFIETNDDKMVEIAKKNFQGKCVTTAQVKNLAILFPSDEGRLKFFNAAFPFVLDTTAYSDLRNQLIDPQYKKQFDQNFAK